MINKLPCLGLFLLSLIFFSCKEAESPPTLLMEEEKLIDILVDIHIAEASMHNLYGDVKDSLATLYYDQIYAIHAIDSTLVNKQLAEIRRHPGYLEELYTKVLEDMSEQEASMNKKKEKKTPPKVIPKDEEKD